MYSVGTYEDRWKVDRQAVGKSVGSEAFRSFLDAVRKNWVTNLVLLKEHKDGDNVLLPYQLVDFQEIHSLPRAWLEKWIAKNTSERFRLLRPTATTCLRRLLGTLAGSD